MTGQNKTPAVMEQRAPAIVDHDSAEAKRWRELDYFATPPFASRAGAELVKLLDPLAAHVWEPACGDGIMAKCLGETFESVWASDISPQGYGTKIDFFDQKKTNFDWIITNPPFARAAEFVRVGISHAKRGVAVLCRLAFLETVDRYALHFGGDPGLTVLAPFCERVPMQLGPWNPKCSTATAYAWFIYCKGHAGSPIIRPVPPGTRQRLSKADDIRRFVAQASLPLLGGQ